MLVPKGLVGPLEPFNFSFFSVTCWDIDLDYHDIEWFALEINRDHSVIFEVASGPITAWQIDQETMETVIAFLSRRKLLLIS